MFRAFVRLVTAGVAAVVAVGCTTAGTGRVAGPAPERRAGVRTAALDSATARQLCVTPDSVVAGRAPCVLRDQRAPLRVF